MSNKRRRNKKRTTNNTATPAVQQTVVQKPQEDNSQMLKSAVAYMNTAKIILRDLENNNLITQMKKKFKKSEVVSWLESPEKNYLKLIEASQYLYNSSNHYRRLIKYFADMALFAHIVIPSKLNMDTSMIDVDKFKKLYQKANDTVDNMNVRHELGKGMTTIFIEDVFFGYEYSTKDSYFIKKLPYDKCIITSIEDGVYQFSFDFSYFDRKEDLLDSWGVEFKQKHTDYVNKRAGRWQELSSEKSICIKLNEEVDYPIPPFVGVLGALFDLEDYKDLKKTGEELGNYKLLSLRIPLNEDGTYKISKTDAKYYYEQMGQNLPENIGLALTPMEISEHKFEQAGQAATNKVAEAENTFWAETGVNYLLFSSDKSGASVVNNSIKTDEEFVFKLFRQFERWLNYKLKRLSGTYKFKIQIMDATTFNQFDFLDNLIKSGTYGVPVRLAIASIFGYSVSDFNSLLFLENDILDLASRMIPLASSHTASGKLTDIGGRPQKGDDDLTDEGNNTRDKDQTREKVIE